MTSQINSYNDLLAEKERLKLLLQAQRELVRQDFEEIKEELAPVRSAINMVGKVVTKDKNNPLLNSAIDLVVDLILKRVVLSKASWLTKLAVPFLTKNLSSHVIADNKDWLLGKLFSFFSKKRDNGQEATPKPAPEEEEED